METVLAWIAAALALVTGTIVDDARYYGYIEGDYVHIAADRSGTVAAVEVRDGDDVAARKVLVRLDDAREKMAIEAALAALRAARASLNDLETGSRSEELAVIEKQWRSARDTLHLARETLDRTEKLSEKGFVPASTLDADRTAVATAEAAVERLDAELAVARLPARAARIEAARQQVKAAEAELARAELDLERRSILAPAAGRIERVVVDTGEFAAAGTPMVSLLPPGNVKVRFFVPEPKRAGLKIGDRLIVGCTSCTAPLPARVTWLASAAEHTPPVIFSREERSKLVFAAEARLEDGAALLPGQPVDVRPAP
jgi:HlyD family secretion protein